MIDLRLGDCLEVLRTLPNNSVDSIVTDPPYGLAFMNKKWDYDVPSVEIWEECLRVLKPGGHLLSFGGSRTYHRMAVAIEDAGFEVRDQIMWVYGSGFPKSHNIGKAIDKRGGESIGWFGEWLVKWRKENNIPQSQIAELFPSKSGGLTGCVSNWELGNNLPTNEQFNKICETFNLPFKSLEEAEREFIGTKTSGIGKAFTKEGWGSGHDEVAITKGNSEWEGWGTALKPAHEPICMARKPISEKSIAENVLKHGTGGINIDDSRIEFVDEKDGYTDEEWKNLYASNRTDSSTNVGNEVKNIVRELLPNAPNGRFPANIMFDEEAGKLLGEPSRFFYCPKVSSKERNAGLSGLPEKQNKHMATHNGSGETSKGMERFTTQPKMNHHPTVKPVKLMEYLITLVTPKGGVVLEPFMGSGSTGIAAKNLGMSFIGIEREQEYFDIAKQRIGE